VKVLRNYQQAIVDSPVTINEFGIVINDIVQDGEYNHYLIDKFVDGSA